MGVLGNSFPPEYKRDSIKNGLNNGSVVKIFSSHTSPPKKKYILLLHIDTFPLFIYINSEINKFKKSKPDFFSVQVKIDSSTNPYLTKPVSYADCSNINNNITLDEIISNVEENFPYWGPFQLDSNTYLEVLSAITSSRMISDFHKEIIINNNK